MSGTLDVVAVRGRVVLQVGDVAQAHMTPAQSAELRGRLRAQEIAVARWLDEERLKRETLAATAAALDGTFP